MRSVRLDLTLENRLRDVAGRTGEAISDVIRRALDEHCERVLGDRLEDQLAHVIGIVHSEGGRARRTGRAFTEMLLRKKASESARPRKAARRK